MRRCVILLNFKFIKLKVFLFQYLLELRNLLLASQKSGVLCLFLLIWFIKLLLLLILVLFIGANLWITEVHDHASIHLLETVPILIRV